MSNQNENSDKSVLWALSDDNYTIRTLLRSWNQEYLLEYLIDEKIDINVLKVMKPHHISHLLRDFKIGDQIRFEHNLSVWRRQIGMPLSFHSFSSELATSTCPPARLRNDEFTSSSSSSLPSCRFSPYVSKHSPKTSVPPSAVISGELHNVQVPYQNPATEISPANFISVSDILNGSAKGKLIADYYKAHNKFEREQRIMLINLIANYFEQNGIHLSLPNSYRLEQEIVHLFPNETIEDYRSGLGKRGKIYIKYCNLKTNFKSLIHSEKQNGNGNGDNAASDYVGTNKNDSAAETDQIEQEEFVVKAEYDDTN